MSIIYICCLIIFTWLMTVNMKLIEPVSLSDLISEKTERNNMHIQRNLDPAYQSVSIKRVRAWYGFGVLFENNDTNDLYLPDYWAIFISSNETILNSEYGACSYFKDFICKQPNCSEDSSSLYSQDYSKFSISEATRLSTPDISIAGGAWKLNSSALYIKSCNIISSNGYDPLPIGQIGLGLSNKAYQNFQTSNPPLFSIIFHSMMSAELIFGFNSSYINDLSSGITLPCDLDWKMRVDRMTIADIIISSDPVSMIFDLQTSSITLPISYYYSLKTYFWSLSSSIQCLKAGTRSFLCVYCGDLAVFPPLIFLLEDETRFLLTPESYLLNLTIGCYSATFVVHNSTLSRADYIILGRDAMSQYYTVFQQLNGATAGITLYPHPVDNTPINDMELARESFDSGSTGSTGSTESATNTVIEHNLLSNNPETGTNTLQETFSLESSTSSPQDREFNPNYENNGAKKTILYAVVGIVLIVMACMFIILRFVGQKGRLQDDQRAERQRATVEMNESSYFVTTAKNVQNNYDDDDDENENDDSE